MTKSEQPGVPPRPASAPEEDSGSSLRAEFRAIFAVYVFSALLPLLAGFACSEERDRRLAQRERAEQEAAEPEDETPQSGSSGPQEG